VRRELRDGVALHHFEHLGDPDDVVACVTGREGGVSRPPWDSLNLAFHVGDDPVAVRENRRRACAVLDLDPDRLTVAVQVHGASVAVVDAATAGVGATAEPIGWEHDALVTDVPGLPLAVLAADCVPIALHDPVRRVVGVVHAGRPGTCAHVTRAAIATMVDRFGCRPDDVRAGLGPSIGPCSYEVGPAEVARARTEFPDLDLVRPTGDGRGLLDLWSANVHELVAAGVRPEHVELSDVDTRWATDAFFSDRAARPCGRHMAVVALRPTPPDPGRRA
jgi:polyphenol oxidase